jgi:hypothetical protein
VGVAFVAPFDAFGLADDAVVAGSRATGAAGSPAASCAIVRTALAVALGFRVAPGLADALGLGVASGAAVAVAFVVAFFLEPFAEAGAG